MIWFGKGFIKFCKSFINLTKLDSTLTCSSARVRINPQALICTVPVFGQGMIFRHSSQEVTYSLQLALIIWERKARKAQASC